MMTAANETRLGFKIGVSGYTQEGETETRPNGLPISTPHPTGHIDSLTLTVPNERRFYGVVRLLVGGLAARLDFAYEQMDDLQLAVESVLHARRTKGAAVTLEASVDHSTLTIAIGPLDLRSSANGQGSPGRIELDRLLQTLVERTDVEERSGETWLRLEKRIPSRSSR
jgi:hypothetical protein